VRQCPRTLGAARFESVERKAPRQQNGAECGPENRAARPEHRADGALRNAPPLFAAEGKRSPLPDQVTTQPLSGLLRSHFPGRLSPHRAKQAGHECKSNQEHNRRSAPIVKSTGQPPAKIAHTVPNAALWPRFDGSGSTQAQKPVNRPAGCVGPSKNRSTARTAHAGSVRMAQPCKGWRELAGEHRPTLARLLLVGPARPCRAVKPLRLRRRACAEPGWPVNTSKKTLVCQVQPDHAQAPHLQRLCPLS
jgi:hypothetical protein